MRNKLLITAGIFVIAIVLVFSCASARGNPDEFSTRIPQKIEKGTKIVVVTEDEEVAFGAKIAELLIARGYEARTMHIVNVIAGGKDADITYIKYKIIKKFSSWAMQRIMTTVDITVLDSSDAVLANYNWKRGYNNTRGEEGIITEFVNHLETWE